LQLSNWSNKQQSIQGRDAKLQKKKKKEDYIHISPMATKLTKPIKTQIANKSALNQVKTLTLV
jgi:hypothetical protein